MAVELFPAPREVQWRDGRAPARAPRRFAVSSALSPEGFRIEASAQGVEIRHADANGRRYAEAVLAQLAGADGSIPALSLRDAPDFPVRGLMLDVSRDRVPTRETLLRWLEVMALGRLNQLQLYVEHAFAYRDHEAVWRHASPLTPDDIAWLEAECADRGIELVPNLNTFGHMGRWLAHPAYRARAEAPEGWVSPLGAQRAPSVLAPTPENAAFAVELAREMRTSFRSPRINIGCDETFELGQGASREAVAEQGRGRVYLDHLLRILQPLRDDGAEVLFWGDMLRNHPELVGELPRDVVALAWHYEAPLEAASLPDPLRERLAGFGTDARALEGFAGQVPAFVEAGLPYWVCPGTSSWNALVGRGGNASANLRDAAAVGSANGAQGYLITDWGDNGHLQPPSVSFGPVLEGAALAWGRAANDDVDVAAWLDRDVLQDENARVGMALTELAGLGERTGLVAYNASPLFDGLLPGRCLVAGEIDTARIGDVLDRLDAIEASLAEARLGCVDAEVVMREIRQALSLARHGAWRLGRRAGATTPDDATLRRHLETRIAEQRACWLLRSREGGLSDSLARLEAEL